MKSYKFIYTLLLSVSIFAACSACSKESTSDDTTPPKEELIKYPPAALQKSNKKAVYVHFMPWFEDKATNDQVGKWGMHWTMANKNPDKVDNNGKREIAAHYYPLTGPYASGDKDIIEYQLLLMKLAGIDGLLIDWPGTTKLYDYPLLVRNTEKLIDKIEEVGLKFAIVYEDQNINIAFDQKVITDKIKAAQNDMSYLRQNYFSKSSYIQLNNKPLLFVFGPQTFEKESEWTQVFAPLSTTPAFFTLWHESNEAGRNATGEFAWVYKNHLTDLNNFYNNDYTGLKFASAYPGFHAYYQEGGWGANPFFIETSNQTFQTTLDLALKSNSLAVQIATWNDYGEGTMIEPTTQFRFSFLTTIQQQLGANGVHEADLELVLQLYQARQKQKTNTILKKKLDQIYYLIAALKLDEAKQLMKSID